MGALKDEFDKVKKTFKEVEEATQEERALETNDSPEKDHMVSSVDETSNENGDDGKKVQTDESGARAAPKRKKRAKGSKAGGYLRKGRSISKEHALKLMTYYATETEARSIELDNDTASYILDFKKEEGIANLGLSMGTIVQRYLDQRPEMFQAQVPKKEQTKVEIEMAQGLWSYLDEIKERSGEGTRDSDVLNAVIRLIADHKRKNQSA